MIAIVSRGFQRPGWSEAPAHGIGLVVAEKAPRSVVSQEVPLSFQPAECCPDIGTRGEQKSPISADRKIKVDIDYRVQPDSKEAASRMACLARSSLLTSTYQTASKPHRNGVQLAWH